MTKHTHRQIGTDTSPIFKITRYELWGNAQDGFDTNNFFKVYEGPIYDPTDKRLLSIVRDEFMGFCFAFTANRSGCMARRRIQLHDPGYMQAGLWDITYDGHVIGQLERMTFDAPCPECDKEAQS